MVDKLTIKIYIQALISTALLYTAASLALAQDSDEQNFDDSRLETTIDYPPWFKLSFGDLRDDLKQAVNHGKNGIIVYYGQKHCPYCAKFFATSLATLDIQHTIQTHYDMIPVDIWGIDTYIDTDGTSYSERALSRHYKTNFTPSVVFYNNTGKAVFRLRGYHSPYQFRAALDYAIGSFYKTETFRDYLDRAVPGMYFKEGGLNERDFFIRPPYNLKKLSTDDAKPLVVFFEQGECHACDLLHTGPLSGSTILSELDKMDAVQLDMWASTAIITPQGKKTTAREWAHQLNIFYAPTLVFFDSSGQEIMRIDSVVEFYRLLGVLQYINQNAYTTNPDYQDWRLRQKLIQ